MTEPEPLRYTGHLFRRAQQRHASIWNEIVSVEVSSVQYAALAVLERRPRASQAELGGELDLDRSTIADLVARLERRGLLERTTQDNDRRRYALSLTTAGVAELTRLRPLVVEANAYLTHALSDDERRTLRVLLQRVLDS